MRPGLTTATQYSGAPLPLPMRVSAGFFVTGLSGNMRIQILPPRLMCLVIAIRAASIWRSVIHAGSRLLSPYSPKLISLPRVATPVMRPRICFRCLTFFGINIAFYSFPIFDCQLAIERQRYRRRFLQIGNWQSAIDNLLLLIVAPRPAAVRSALAFAARPRTALTLTGARFVD